MSEEKPKYQTEIEDAMNMIGKGYGHDEPAAVIEQPRARMVLRESISEEWTAAWVKLSTAFKPHIKNLRGAPLAVWLYLSLSINKNGEAFPGIRTMAEDLGYSHQGVLDAIESLEEKGYLTVKRGEKRHNFYKPEFAAIGRGNEPKNESTKLTRQAKSQLLEPEESTFSADESSALDSNKNNKREQDIGVPPNYGLDWKIANGQTDITPADDKHARMVDAANAIAITHGADAEKVYGLVMAFQAERGIVFTESQIKGQRKAIKFLLEKKVTPDHVRQAVRKLIEIKYSCTDMYAIQKVADELANPAPEASGYNPLGLEIGL